MAVQLPHEWRPRRYQRRGLWSYLQRGGKRAVAVWHRRAGKDAAGLHWTTCAAMQRVGTYWHMLPTLQQGRKVIWEGITKSGQRVLDAWPSEIVSHRRNDEMKLELANGSIWQVVGSDNYDSLVGSNPVGVIFSEYSVADPRAWDYIRPILAENGGWAAFLYTPRGRNHGAKLYEMARSNPDWHASLLTVDDTRAIAVSAVDDERRAGMSEEMIQQEFYCSFEASLQGAYYAKELRAMTDEHRIGRIPIDDHVMVDTAWDLGIGDATAIWLIQRVGKEIRLVDYYEASGEALAHYVRVLRERGYVYGRHFLPHDAAARELQTGKSRVEALNSLGVKVEVIPQHRIEDGIEETRRVLRQCWLDEERCARGLDALRQYRCEYDDARQGFRDRPVHDWTSHAADALRTYAMAPERRGSWAPIQYGKSGVV